MHTKAHQVMQLLWALCTQTNAISSIATQIILKLKENDVV